MAKVKKLHISHCIAAVVNHKHDVKKKKEKSHFTFHCYFSYSAGIFALKYIFTML